MTNRFLTQGPLHLDLFESLVRDDEIEVEVEAEHSSATGLRCLARVRELKQQGLQNPSEWAAHARGHDASRWSRRIR
jgi:hypothetical protein